MGQVGWQSLGVDIAVPFSAKIQDGAKDLPEILIDDPALQSYTTEPYTHGMYSVINEFNPEIVLYGATTIGRWSRMLAEADALVLYVVSAYRVLTQTPEEAAAMLPAIQDHAHLTANAILNTSNLGDETTMEHVEHGRAFAREVARLCGLPLAATVVPEACIQNSAVPLDEQPFMTSPEEPVLVMPRYVKRPWE